MVERLVFEPGFLKEVESPGLVKDDFIANERLQSLVGSRINKPLHLPMETTLDRTEPRNDAIFEILDMGEHFVFFHAERELYARMEKPVLKILSDTR